jgi:hypothetical protein
MEIFLAVTAGVLVLGGALAVRAIKKRIKKWKRRRGGVYLWRVDHHRNRARRVNGYVGETVSFYHRARQHMGTSNYAVGASKRSTVAVKVPAQPWSDLNPVCRQIIKLPWWLCWKWVLRPLETLVMLCTWPVYNDAKNRWNPRRIPKSLARVQRSHRDAGARGATAFAYRAKVTMAHGVRIAVQVAGAIVIMVGIYGWVINR